MAYFILKTEPSTYSYEDLEREKKTVWDGVTNPLALKHLRAAKKGDLAAVYHTGGERRVVGVAEVAADARGDVVEVRAKKRLAEPVGLDVLKKTPAFADSPLLKMGRLSVVPLTVDQWKALLALAKTSM